MDKQRFYPLAFQCAALSAAEGLSFRSRTPAAFIPLPLRGKSGGPGGIRTLDLLHAMEARSQLRHRPALRCCPYNLAHVPGKL